MRLRNKKGADEKLHDSKWMLPNDIHFLLSKPKLEMEIGMGKGDFIIAKAIDHKDINFVGVEMYPTVQLSAIKKLDALETKPNNIMLLDLDARKLEEIIKPLSLDKIYLNFSDPWPKAKHAKRRLMFRSFLDLYFRILKPDGEIEIKTDQKPLYEFALEEFDFVKKYKILDKSIDLHNREKVIYQTEYEKKFVKMGNPIFYVKVKKAS